MKRWTVVALAAASLLSAAAIANTQLSHETPSQRLRAHEREKVREYVPSVNAVLEGQTVGASVIPSF